MSNKAFQYDKRDDLIFKPLVTSGRWFYYKCAFFAALLVMGLSGYFYQLIYGMGITGLNRPVFWGVYITNFVFFIGISHAGTLISAILRVLKLEWRRPFTRMAEAITVFSLPFAMLSILADLGRPDRILNILKYGRLESPLLWDVICVSTYLTTSIIYFFLALVPDFAIIRDRLEGISAFRRKIYTILAFGFTGTDLQIKWLDRVLGFLSIFLTFLVISVHTVVSWVFGLTLQPGWHSAAIGPYFLVGAVFSGVATLVIVSVIIRKAFNLYYYINDSHFDVLGRFLLILTIVWTYFTFAEFITVFYGNEPLHMNILIEKFTGDYFFMHWVMLLSCFVIPLIILSNKKTRKVRGIFIASIFINIGMWFERYTVIIPSQASPRLPYPEIAYSPSLAELAITIGYFSGFILFYMLFTKFFPVLSIWEIKEGEEEGICEGKSRLEGYLPGKGTTLGIIFVCLTLVFPKNSPAGNIIELPENPVNGLNVFFDKGCMKCHSIKGIGADIGPDLGHIKGDYSLIDFVGVMWNHFPSMTQGAGQIKRVWPSLTADEMKDMVSFIYYLNFINPVGNSDDGESVFKNRGCINCHKVGDVGGKVGPPFDEFKNEIAPFHFVKGMWNHAPLMAKELKKKNLKWPVMENSDISDLLSYIRKEGKGIVNDPIYVAPGNPGIGKEIFKSKNCTICHPIFTNKKDEVFIGPDLRKVKLKSNIYELITDIWNHQPLMREKMEDKKVKYPEFKTVKEVTDLLTFLYFIQYTKSAGNAKQGKKLFQLKGCYGCHVKDRKDGNWSAPEIFRSYKKRSSLEFSTAIWNHASLMYEEIEKKDIVWPRFYGNEFVDLVSYIIGQNVK